MGFTWIDVTAGVIATAAQINQVKTNADTLAANLGMPPLTWNNLPVSPGDKQQANQVQELQGNLDTIDTSNVCSSDNAVQYTTDNSGFDSGADTSKNNTVDVDQHATYDSDQNTGILTDHNSTVYNDRHATYDVDQNTTVYSGLDTTYYSPRNASAK